MSSYEITAIESEEYSIGKLTPAIPCFYEDCNKIGPVISWEHEHYHIDTIVIVYECPEHGEVEYTASLADW